jgi:hypothetical protein
MLVNPVATARAVLVVSTVENAALWHPRSAAVSRAMRSSILASATTRRYLSMQCLVREPISVSTQMAARVAAWIDWLWPG